MKEEEEDSKPKQSEIKSYFIIWVPKRKWESGTNRKVQSVWEEYFGIFNQLNDNQNSWRV